MNTKRLAVAVAVTVAAPAAALMIAAQPAFAATCAGDFCAQFTYISGNEATVQIQTINGFVGHYELQTPNHGVHNTSGDVYWYPGETVSLTEDGGVGNWCITEWIWDGGNAYTKGSYECLSD